VTTPRHSSRSVLPTDSLDSSSSANPHKATFVNRLILCGSLSIQGFPFGRSMAFAVIEVQRFSKRKCFGLFCS